MTSLQTLLTIIHVLVCFFLIFIVLLQPAKGGGAGAAFGGGSSETLLGSGGALPLLNKITTLAAVVFMLTSVSLAYISVGKTTSSAVDRVLPGVAAEKVVTQDEEDKKQADEPAASSEPVVSPLPADNDSVKVEVKENGSTTVSRGVEVEKEEQPEKTEKSEKPAVAE